MPAETHQHGRSVGCEDIIVLLSTLLDLKLGAISRDATLRSLGLEDDPALWDLWDAVREEFGERTIGPDEVEALDLNMTLEEAAVAMARLLAPRDGKEAASMPERGSAEV